MPTAPPSNVYYDVTQTTAGVEVAFSEQLDDDEQASLIDWLAEQHHFRYVQYIVDRDGREAVLLTNRLDYPNG